MKQANFATFTIITFIFILAWMGFSIYHALETSSISAELQQDTKAINGTFDEKTITSITKRTIVEPAYTAIQPLPTVNPVITQTATTAATITTAPTQATYPGLPEITPSGGTP